MSRHLPSGHVARRPIRPWFLVAGSFVISVAAGCGDRSATPSVPPPGYAPAERPPAVSARPRPSSEPFAIGAAASPIDVAHWLTRPAPSLDVMPGDILVIDFVASWCPHSRAVVPQLNALQRRYADRGVRIVAVTHEPVEDARAILEPEAGTSGGGVPEFPVGTDPDLSTHADYLDAAGEDGVPTAFLVGRDGRIEWFGHPDILEEPLRQVVEGTWDRDAFAARRARIAPLSSRVIDILDGFAADTAAAVGAYRELVAEHAGRPEELNEIAWLLVEAAENVRIDSDPAIGELVAIADTAVQESLRLAPDEGNTLDTLAHLQALRGDIAAALETQRRAAANPGLYAPRIRRYLGELEARATQERTSRPR